MTVQLSHSVVSPYLPAAQPQPAFQAALPDHAESSEEAAPTRSKTHKVALALVLAAAAASGACATSMSPPPETPPSQSMPVQNRTALQKHVDYFDADGDGQIPISETYNGLRALGLGRARATLAATLINTIMGPATSSSWLSPTTIDIDNIHLGVHGSDSGVYDDAGNFVPEKFEEMFPRFDTNQDNALSGDELNAMRAANETDSGSVAAKAEFDMLLRLAGQDQLTSDGHVIRVMTRERMAQLYDGTLFHNLAAERAAQQAQ
ncbi:MAG: hypothetical protein FJX76_03845 [Armatimonadetes bacterium]|nr:hypothetical protein [Armatimonadota bacterium]